MIIGRIHYVISYTCKLVNHEIFILKLFLLPKHWFAWGLHHLESRTHVNSYSYMWQLSKGDGKFWPYYGQLQPLRSQVVTTSLRLTTLFNWFCMVYCDAAFWCLKCRVLNGMVIVTWTNGCTLAISDVQHSW